MDREPVESSMITSIGYDQSSGTVEVEFKSNGQVWQYFDVPEVVFQEFKASSSIGKAFNALIKTHYREARVS